MVQGGGSGALGVSGWTQRVREEVGDPATGRRRQADPPQMDKGSAHTMGLSQP